nr:uncharacterized protein LOC129433961 isoform X3 [Misgurnus anguillicaudatus]
MPEAKFKVTTARPLGLIMSAICRPHFTISFLVLHPKLNRLDCLSRTTGTLQGFASHIDVIDEERYDTGVKAAKNEKEVLPCDQVVGPSSESKKLFTSLFQGKNKGTNMSENV